MLPKKTKKINIPVLIILWVQKMELLQCVNATLCLPEKPKLVVGLKAATANTFVDNAAYRDFLYDTFGVSSSDMESSAVAMVVYSMFIHTLTYTFESFSFSFCFFFCFVFHKTCVSNGYPVIVIRGLSDLAGAQTGDNAVRKFGSLAATNTARAVLEFIKKLPPNYNLNSYV